ncbi:HEPN domain-containing protein [Thermotoga sp. SG1]
MPFRYPDTFYIPSREEAREALEFAEKVRDFTLKKLGGVLR